jgi:hypothetical protein
MSFLQIGITYPGRLNRCRESPAKSSGSSSSSSSSSIGGGGGGGGGSSNNNNNNNNNNSPGAGYDLRAIAVECAAAMVEAGLVGVEDDVPFCLMGHGMGAIVAYEVNPCVV